MAKRNEQAKANPVAANANRAAQNNASTEFAAETNAAEVRRQNQQSAARAQANNQVTE